jgi:hypothetical protein
MKTIKLRKLHEKMHDYNNRKAPAWAACDAWDDFVNACLKFYATLPWSEAASLIEPSQDFTARWLAVANEELGSAYDAAGARITAAGSQVSVSPERR